MSINKQEVKEWVMTILTAVVLVIIIRAFILDSRIVPTPSMVPTIQCGDRLFVEKITHRFWGLERGEVIVFVPPKQSQLTDDLIKRLIGLPGDIIEIKDGTLYINNEPQEEPYLAESIQYEYGPVKVPEGKIFVLGDNRNRSYDSHEWGFADLDSVKGKALITYWPLDRLKYWK
ncbi:MAG: signal peptidase I [Clostridia bacterium]|jgi:signal peptidase I|nr:signal peptidase I [Clostridia bacterium]